jgi:hypothetical protein
VAIAGEGFAAVGAYVGDNLLAISLRILEVFLDIVGFLL